MLAKKMTSSKSKDQEKSRGLKVSKTSSRILNKEFGSNRWQQNLSGKEVDK
jgi:hypothetical protein